MKSYHHILFTVCKLFFSLQSFHLKLLPPTYFDGPNNFPINSMQVPVESTVLAPSALLTKFLVIWASVSVYTLGLIAVGAILARRHPAYISER